MPIDINISRRYREYDEDRPRDVTYEKISAADVAGKVLIGLVLIIALLFGVVTFLRMPSPPAPPPEAAGTL